MQFISREMIPPSQHFAVALGTFDGLHIGHQKIIDTLLAQAPGLRTLVYTFTNLPSSLFKNTQFIYSLPEKVEIFKQSGIDFLMLETFTPEMSDISAVEFMDFLAHTLHAKKIVIGFNYTFGKRGVGNPQMLQEYCTQHGIEVITVPPVELDGIVSSTRIRKALQSGDILLANRLLGRQYSITSTVIHGDALGRSFGYNTANQLPIADKIIPTNGVYATLVDFENKQYKGITNIGYRPTVSSNMQLRIETHILDFDEMIYGRNITVRFVDKIRNEIKFSGINELKTQLDIDKQKTIELLCQS